MSNNQDAQAMTAPTLPPLPRYELDAHSPGASPADDGEWVRFDDVAAALQSAAPAAQQGGEAPSNCEVMTREFFLDTAEFFGVIKKGPRNKAIHCAVHRFALYLTDPSYGWAKTAALQSAAPAAQQAAGDIVYVSKGQLREILNGNVMNVLMASEPDRFADAPLYTHAPATPQAEPVTLGALAKRNIFDAIREAYDLGYNDARNARAIPGDSAPGYAGRDVEADHGGALLNTLNRRLATTPPQAVQPEKCRTCNGHGLVGGHMQDGSGYGEGCPDCNPEPTAAASRAVRVPMSDEQANDLRVKFLLRGDFGKVQTFIAGVPAAEAYHGITQRQAPATSGYIATVKPREGLDWGDEQGQEGGAA